VGTVHHDLHTTIAAERDVAELLSLAAWLHTQATVPWLSITNAPIDLRWQALTLARHAVGDRDTTAPVGLVAAAPVRISDARVGTCRRGGGKHQTADRERGYQDPHQRTVRPGVTRSNRNPAALA
jgi:hypothetical protein